MASLREKLLNLGVENVDDGRPFIPERPLKQILTESAIEETLSDPQLTQLILEGGRRLLGILVLIRREDAVWRFLQRDHGQLQDLDSRLPLKLNNLKIIFGEDGGAGSAAAFFETQWRFLAPLLRNDRSHRIFDDLTILPFVEREDWATSSGFGDISKITICPIHQQLVDLDLDGNAIVIRKRINSKNHQNAENEEERILASLRAVRHPNIIALLASYRYRGAYNLIFPVADCDLEALLRGHMKRPPNLCYDHTILREIHGISSAVEIVHNFFVGEYDLKMVGCHYDLKPKNIVIRDDKFLLTDFGLSRLELSDVGLEESQIRVQGFYYAPECQPTLENSSAGQKADVWSFGCILAMIATFLQYGPNGVAEFETNRKIKTHIPNRGTFITKSFHANGQLNPAVQDWLKRIKEDSRSQSACLLGIVSLIQQILKSDPKERPEMTSVTKDLSFIAHKAMFEFSCDRFQFLLRNMSSLSPGGPIELDVESKRYRIWGDAAGFKGEYEDIRKQNITQPQEFTSGISDILADIEEELQFIESWSARNLSPTFVRLKTLNDKLWASMSPQLVDEMNRMLQSAMNDGRICEDLQYISQTLQSDISSEYNDIGALTGSKHYVVDSETIESTNETYANSGKHDELLLQNFDFCITSQFDAHSIGTSQQLGDDDGPACVLVEWITYNSHWGEELYARVPKIARLLSNSTWIERSGLQVLQCRGYCREERKKRFGLVYEIPMLSPKPITLRKLIKSTNKRRDRPMLGQIFELARKIVHCVLEVHKVGWLHKTVSSYNIVFLPTTASEPVPVVSPYLIGFNHSHDEHRQSTTEGPADEIQRQYHHPEYLQNGHGFRPEHDYYSVGLVLLEIGRWRILSQLTRRMVGLTLHQRSEELVKECVNNLRNSMGDRYCDAVKACLTSDFGESCDRNEIRDQFEAKVVKRLAKCMA
ncbi:hypothetical protein BDD12DRAFT_834625 [Trichophaea hybrida]|nr:hypothetical protein BDD12DRAFT_834625 [Trichophaea hybrida]